MMVVEDAGEIRLSDDFILIRMRDQRSRFFSVQVELAFLGSKSGFDSKKVQLVSCHLYFLKQRDLRVNASPFALRTLDQRHLERHPLHSKHGACLKRGDPMASRILRDGNYHMQWYEGAKKRRRSLRTDSLQIAKEKVRQFESAQFAGHDCALPTRTPVGEIVAAYIENMKVRSHERSWSKDIAYLRAAFGECCDALTVPEGRASRCRELRCPEDRRKRIHPIGARYFEEISTAMISDMIAQHVRVKGLSPITANRYREVVSKVFDWAIKQQRV